MEIQANSKLLMIGDSITDCGRAQPIGEGSFEALGKGYVAYVAGLLDTVYPDKHIRVVNMGIGGNTVRDLKARWQSDVIELKPDWLSVMIGVNDVWRHFGLPLQSEIHVSIGEYETTLDELTRITAPTLKGLVLMTPFFIELNHADPMRAMIDSYGMVIRKLALRYGAILVDTQTAFDRVLQHCHAAALSWDRVHPNVTGHMILTHAFLDAIGFTW